jgi:hypothetical protein
MKKVFAIAFAAVTMAAGASAQSPDGQFGVGATVGSISGAQVQYAISPAVHIGTMIGLSIEDGGTSFSFGPYGKFILAGSKEFKPYVLGQLAIMRNSVTVGNVTSSTTTTSLVAGAGAEYFITPNFGVFATVPVLTLPFEDGATVSFGILSPTVGVEWFFN